MRNRFRLKLRRLAKGMRDESVSKLKVILKRRGFLDPNAPETEAFDQDTERAVAYFQKVYGLEVDGWVGEQTLGVIEKPVCGVADRPEGMAAFTLGGCKYNSHTLTYHIVNTSPDLPAERCKQIIRESFGVWAAVTPLRFTEVPLNANPTFRISFERGEHGDGRGAAFDGVGNVLAHAYYPPPCGGVFAGHLHFDEDEQWTDGPSQGRKISLQSTAIHEIGHNLGLDHSDDPNSIMYAYLNETMQLTPDDVAGIQALYGRQPEEPEEPEPPVDPFTPILLSGSLKHRGAEMHQVEVLPGKYAVEMNGFRGADFDVYVRRDRPVDTRLYDVRGFSPESHELVKLKVKRQGILYILAHSYRGEGAYQIEVRREGRPPRGR